MIKMVTVAITTDASGDFTTTTGNVNGYFVGYRYVAPGADALDNLWDLTVAGAITGMSLVLDTDMLPTSAQNFIAQAQESQAGVITDPDQFSRIPVAEALTVTVANGGNVQSGTLYLLFED